MLAKVTSSALMGVDAYMVEVEVDLSKGLPAFIMVGLPDTAVKESRERVKAAIVNSEHKFPMKVVVVNLAPASVKKSGSCFDLPIAIGVLAAAGVVNRTTVRDYVIAGELTLNGEVRPVKGALPLAVAARANGYRKLIVPQANVREAAVVEGLDVFAVKTLPQAVDLLRSGNGARPYVVDIEKKLRQEDDFDIDFHDVKGQEHAKRALEVAAAGGHNVVMIGAPGAGKTMLAQRVPTVLPSPTLAEAIETTKIHSVLGLTGRSSFLITRRPFRSPHHTISDAGMIGGGVIPRPGEVSLAHNGVLFLDELPEFNRNVLEVLRQPLEDARVTISRAATSLTFPARFTLIAAMNPCPCGYYGDPMQECNCTPLQVRKYIHKISGPLLDRIDIHINVPAIKYKELAGERRGERSAEIRDRVERTRRLQVARFAADNNGKARRFYCNADIPPAQLPRYCGLAAGCQELLRHAIEKLGLSARAYDRVLKVARTIADLGGEETIQPAYIAEAVQYRTLDRSWQ